MAEGLLDGILGEENEKTEEFLTDQPVLPRIQAKHLKEEQQLRLQHLIGQVERSAIRRFAARIRATAELTAAALEILIAVGALTLVISAPAAAGVGLSARLVVDARNNLFGEPVGRCG